MQHKSEPVEPPRLAEPLSRLPWSLAQMEFGIVGADFLGQMGRLLVAHAKDQRMSQAVGFNQESGPDGAGVAKDQRPGQVPERTAELNKEGGPVAKDEIRGVAG